jgi:ElaB/YqjD/DUF883 family membrane-anchored ribosome-binding protein
MSKWKNEIKKSLSSEIQSLLSEAEELLWKINESDDYGFKQIQALESAISYLKDVAEW